MTTSATLFTEFIIARVQHPSGVSLREEGQVNLFLIDDLIRSVSTRVLHSRLSEEEELWLIDLLDALQIEKERIEGKIEQVKQENSSLGWHLHLRSQSGFELLE